MCSKNNSMNKRFLCTIDCFLVCFLTYTIRIFLAQQCIIYCLTSYKYITISIVSFLFNVFFSSISSSLPANWFFRNVSNFCRSISCPVSKVCNPSPRRKVSEIKIYKGWRLLAMYIYSLIDEWFRRILLLFFIRLCSSDGFGHLTNCVYWLTRTVTKA